MKFRIDAAAIKAAARTAGALMLGNAVVAVLLLGNRDWLAVGSLLGLGVLVIVVTSLER